MGRISRTGGVAPLGHKRIQFDFTIDGVRYRPTLPWIPHEANLRRAREHLRRIKARILAGTFIFTDETEIPGFASGFVSWTRASCRAHAAGRRRTPSSRAR